MNDAEHLPGPWHWHNKSLVQSNGYIVANAIIPKVKALPVIDVRQADAQLIAEAPRLLAACQKAIEEAVADEQDEWFAEMQSAIARATGQPKSK